MITYQGNLESFTTISRAGDIGASNQESPVFDAGERF